MSKEGRVRVLLDLLTYSAKGRPHRNLTPEHYRGIMGSLDMLRLILIKLDDVQETGYLIPYYTKKGILKRSSLL